MKIPRLHQAVIENDLEFITQEKATDLAYERDEQGFTAKELALLLGKHRIAEELGYTLPAEILVEHLDKKVKMPLTLFEKSFNLKFSPTITFENHAALLQTIKECPLTMRFFARTAKESKALCSIGFIDEEIGYGLFTKKILAKGSYIGEYAGLVSQPKLSSDSKYMAHYPTRFFSMNPYVIDAKFIANLTRFINHSGTPNLEPGFILDRGLVHIGFFANRLILAQEELTLDYGKDYWSTRKVR